MSMPIESISALQTFVQAAEKRSFKAAGEIVGLTPSAVGKAIQKLEEQLSTRLFHRSTRSITITEEGGLFLERCRRILAEIDAAQAEVAQASAEPRGRLKISLPVEPVVLLPAISHFNTAYPAIELDLDINDRFVDVVEEGFDAVIQSGEPKDSRLRHRRLGDFTWRLVASPGYLEHHGTPQTLSDLADHRCLRQRFAQTGRLMHWPTEPELEATALPASIITTMMEPLIELAKHGRGIAYLPHFAVQRSINSGLLIELLPGLCHRSGTLNLLWPASRFPMAKVRVFVDFMTTWMAKEFANLQQGQA